MSSINQVKAKFKCMSVTDYGPQKQAHLTAVYEHGTNENADFTSATPWGELKINIMADRPAADFFKPGISYYLAFVPES